MGRKIILLSDGTGNSSAKVWRTNVWRTFEALDLSGNDQVAFYDDGVGTSSFKPMAILGGAFGLGLRRNVIALYKFACRNYRDKSDELFGFGFSRGAFTIRIVMGLIDSQGLVQADSEGELHSLASAAYRAYRRERYEHLKFEAPYQWIRNKFGPHYPPPRVHKDITISFVGVWDTVAAYGMPIDEMTKGIHQYLWPIELPNNHLSCNVKRACQALALDEERTTFHPQVWDETPRKSCRKCAGSVCPVQAANSIKPPASPGQPRLIENERLSQVWFSGVHTNVGGGYPDDALAYIPFVWMITEARRHGLKFKSDYAGKPPSPDLMISDPDTFKSATSKRDKDGRVYDPRKGFGGYYRYGPRKLVPHFYRESKKLEDDEVDVGRAKIHESVFKRIENHAHAYAPVGLPPYYDVVTDGGEIVSPDNYKIVPATQPFETSPAAAARALSQEHVWNEVWKRRIAYFATVGATLWLLMFPLTSSAERYDEFTSPIRWMSDLIRFAGGFLPNFASTWIDGYARAPGWFTALALLVALLMWWSSHIASRTANLMASIWRKTADAPAGLPDNWIYRLRSNRAYIGFHDSLKNRIAPAFFAVVFLYLGLALINHVAYDMQDVAGYACVRTDTDAPTPLHVDKRDIPDPSRVRIVKFNTSDLCHATGILLTHGARYRITVTSIPSTPGSPALASTPSLPGEGWLDGMTRISVPVGGFSTKASPAWYERIYLSLLLPLRREMSQDWFRIGLRFGNVGGEERFYVPDPYDDIIQFNITPTIAPESKDPKVPKHEEELFVFVNDAVIGIPGFYDLLYRRNRGAAYLTVQRIR